MARKGRRGGSRGGRKAAVRQLPWRALRNPYRPLEVLSADQIETIHEASLDLLETMGMDFLDDDACAVLRRAGADVKPGDYRVRFDRNMVLEAVSKAPAKFTLYARNPAHDVVFGENNVVFSAVASAPFCSDLDSGRRAGNHRDYCNFLRLAQSLNIVHVLAGYPVEPVDLAPETRHLDCAHGALTLTDKVWHAYALGAYRCADSIDMLGIARAMSRDELRARPGLFTIVNTSSPMRVDGPMLRGLKEMALAGQAVGVTPFTLAGAMSPVTLAGALTQQNAEALAVIAYAQIVAPGAPCLYGGFTSNVDMRSGAPAFGTPEYVKAAIAGGQLARRYGLPYRSSNVNAANAPDAQAAWESMMSLWGVLTGGANLVMHGAGWMEGGLVASFEKMVMDADMLQMIAEVLQPIQVDDETIGLDAIREVGPGGHFFGAAHTLARYKTAFYEPLVSDWRNFESWTEAGSPTAERHANAVWKKLLAEYTPPPTEPDIDESLRAFMERRRREIRTAAA